MEEKLTLEHLAPYLPYELKVKTKYDIEELSMCNSEGAYLMYKYDLYPLSSFKPLLHPLSKLTEEIEHNGERIIVADIIFPKNEYKNEYDRSIDIGALQLQNAIGHSCTYYSVVRELFKYHFDVFGLIEKGLAIEKQ